MSVAPHTCETCAVEGLFDGAERFPAEGAEATFAVAWRCPKCDAVTADLCPIGPIEPGPSSCLNCGADTPDGAKCMGCGMAAPEALAFLGVDGEAPSVEDGVAALEEGRIRHALAVFNLPLQRDEAVAKAWEEKAKVYQSLRLNEAALRCYRRTIALAPDPLLEIALACALSDLERHDEAIATYDAVLPRAGDATTAAIIHANRGNSHDALDRHEAAIADYEAAIGRERARASHYANYARSFSRRKRWAEAEEILSRGLTHVEGLARVGLLVEKARVANEQEKAEEALAAAEAALDVVDEHPRALYQCAWALGMLGRLDEARSRLDKLLALEPGNTSAKQALAKIEAALPDKASAHARSPWWKFWN